MTSGEEFVRVEDEEMIWVIPIDNRKRILWAIQDALLKVGELSERTALVRRALADEPGLYMTCELTSIFGYDHGLFGEKGPLARTGHLIDKDSFDDILGRTIERIRRAASDGSLASHSAFMHIVAEWMAFGQEAEAVAWVGQNAGSDRFLVSILRQTVRKIRRQGANDLTARESLAIDFEYLGRFIEAAAIRSRCQSLHEQRPGWLGSDDRKLIELVLSSLNPDGSPVGRRG